MCRSDDDEGAPAAGEERLQLRQPVLIAFDEEPSVHHGVLLEVGQHDPFDRRGITRLPGIGQLGDAAHLGVDAFQRVGEQPILLLRGHAVEQRDLVIRRLQALDRLAVALRAVVEVLVETQTWIEAGFLPFEGLDHQRQHPRLELLEQFDWESVRADVFAHLRVGFRRHDFIERLLGRQPPPHQDAHLRLGAEHLAQVGLFNDQVGVLEGGLERRVQRIVVLRQHVDRADEIDRALFSADFPDEVPRRRLCGGQRRRDGDGCENQMPQAER